MTDTTTILLGSIGTLVETSELQRRAFNAAFQEAELGWDWDIATYKKRLTTSGGQQRIESFAAERGMAVDVAALHARKTEIFDHWMIEDGLDLRPGVVEVIQSAKSQNLTLGFVTSTSVANIDAIFAGLHGQLSKADFAFIGSASLVENSKPSPDIYVSALSALGVGPDSCVAIEDTAVSMKAAVAAGVRCIAYPGAYAQIDDFENGTTIIREALSLDLLINDGRQGL